MAQIHGTSSVWKEISAKLEAQKLNAAHPADVYTLLDENSQSYGKQMAGAMAALEDEIALLVQEVERERQLAHTELATFTDRFSLEFEQAQVTLDYYQHDKNIFSPLRNIFRITRESRKLERLRRKIEEHRIETERPLRLKEALLDQKIAEKEPQAREQCSQTGAQVELLESLSGSQELAQALAEDEMVGYLQGLPEEVRVINHLALKVEQGFKQAGGWLIRGNIDHLVITPAGLFAIQVMNLSKQRAEKPSSGSLGEQINAAASLCYMMLKPDYPGATVRGILAYRGHLPENANISAVKALPLQEVGGYISWFKEKTLDEKSMQEIAAFLISVNAE